MKVLLHVNYYEGANKLDELFRIAQKFGYDGVELRWKYKFDDMNQKEYRNKLINLKSQYPDFEITFGGAVDFCRGKEDEVKAETANYLEFLEWSKKELDTRVMNFFTGAMIAENTDYMLFHLNGSGMADEGDYERAAAGLKIVGEKAAELDMLIALETHNCYLHDLVKPCKKLMDMTRHDAVGINWDQGNILLNENGESIDEVFDILDGKIYYAHLKNVLVFQHKLYLVTQLEQGHIDTMHAVKKLKTNLKSGICATEYSAPGDGIIAAKRDMEYMKYIKDWLEID
ncbi:MAG: sugar phosphate isomerase/epimerase [Victivallaceae bacterium]|nr:sugar phosphate isomerase/epimerase [Victivallaceae bacterium]